LQTTKLHYVESGAESDHVVLLLHGFPDCFFGWRYQIPVLSRYHRVIALDLKGFSDSDKPLLRHNYRPSKICSELKDFLDALSIKSATIIGHDLGGLIGWIFALTFPDYVNRLITISAPHPNYYWQPLKTAQVTRKWSTMVQVSAARNLEMLELRVFIFLFSSDLIRNLFVW
jgi:epoxide hydrolase 4